jgi:trehalose-6-phosphate synthase
VTAGSTKRLIVVSNRLPYVLEKHNGDKWALKPGSGGLVTALLPVLRNRGGIWIGWPGVTDEVPNVNQIFRDAARGAGYALEPVSLTQEEVDKYYHGYSNESVWPLFHDLQSRCEFDPEYWHAYVKVNRKFAETLARDCRPDDFVWIHDYQLMDVAYHVRAMACPADLAFFLHIPFPAPDIFMKLPECHAVLTSLLAYDLVGLQTLRDRRNFVQCVRMLVKSARVRIEGHLHVVKLEDREMRVGNFPIGIDAAASPAKRLRRRSRIGCARSGRGSKAGRSCWDWTGWTTPRASLSVYEPSPTFWRGFPKCEDASTSSR